MHRKQLRPCGSQLVAPTEDDRDSNSVVIKRSREEKSEEREKKKRRQTCDAETAESSGSEDLTDGDFPLAR